MTAVGNESWNIPVTSIVRDPSVLTRGGPATAAFAHSFLVSTFEFRPLSS